MSFDDSILFSDWMDCVHLLKCLNFDPMAQVTSLAISPLGGYDARMTAHTSHPDILKRLKRAQGHLKSIIDMLEDDRDCLDVAQQLQAVEKAITNAKKTLVHDHIDHCLENAVKKGSRNPEDTVRQFKEITKYL
jgi:DNA-binding FrmR family transcriptional regulator